MHKEMKFRDSIFKEEIIQQVWQKGEPIIDINNDFTRRDCFGNWIRYEDYGNIQSFYGWVIDRIDPHNDEIRNNVENLQPLNWKNKISKDCGGL